jgi:AraC-like DNA-binding protein
MDQIGLGCGKPGLRNFYRYFSLTEQDREWGMYVTTTGETGTGPNEPYPPPGHPKGYAFEWSRGRTLQDLQVIYISTGRGWFESAQTPPQAIEAGTVFLLFPGVWHRYMPEPATGWQEHWVGIDGDIPRRWVRNGFFSPQAPVLKPVEEETLRTLYARIVEAAKTDQPALQQVMTGAASQIVGQIYSAQQARPTGEQRSASAVEQAIERMRDDPGSDLDLPELATQLGVSYSWLRRTFAERTGISPHQYFLGLRLVRARKLLLQTGLSVKEIAQEVGFEDEHYFCRLFRRKSGATPTEWRRSQRAEVATEA